MKSKRTATLVLHPLGTFKGYGGFVGINPYKELPENTSPRLVGKTLVDLLDISGPTGFHINDIDTYRNETADAETIRIRNKYLSDVSSTRALGKQFIHVEVSKDDKRKSWRVVKFKYDAKKQSLVPSAEKRVRTIDGDDSLGESVCELLVP